MEFEKVYRAYFGDVFRYLTRLCSDEALAEELTSETFFKALRGLDGFRGECEVRVWLRRIAKNCFLSHLKRQRRFSAGEPEELLAALPAPDDVEGEALERSDARRIRALLHRLSEPYREVFTLRVLDEMSFRQIGALFGRTENWACVTYHRAKAKITEQMEETQDENQL